MGQYGGIFFMTICAHFQYWLLFVRKQHFHIIREKTFLTRTLSITLFLYHLHQLRSSTYIDQVYCTNCKYTMEEAIWYSLQREIFPIKIVSRCPPPGWPTVPMCCFSWWTVVRDMYQGQARVVRGHTHTGCQQIIGHLQIDGLLLQTGDGSISLQRVLFKYI